MRELPAAATAAAAAAVAAAAAAAGSSEAPGVSAVVERRSRSDDAPVKGMKTRCGDGVEVERIHKRQKIGVRSKRGSKRTCCSCCI